MELIGPIIEVIKCCGGPTCRYIDHHRKYKELMVELRGEVNALKSREQDIESRKEAELRCRKVVKKEVEKWFKDVQRVETDMQEIEKKFDDVSYFLRGHLGKLIYRKIKEVKGIYIQGSFPNGVAIDGPPYIGMRLPTTNLEGEVNVKERIWEYLMGDEVGMIGVCGMGGIGKTTIMKHINNRLVEERKKFDHVIWVTVSKDLNIFKVQKAIADSLKESLSEDELQQRAARLKDIFERKRYVLILDDVWERFSLLDVGIIEPTLGAGRKVVLTSRLIDVCNSMGCNVVKVQPLSKEESMNLFLDGVGHSVVQDQNLKCIVNKIVEECGGLPLSIVTTAGSMKGEHDICEWRNAFTELEEHMESVRGSDNEVFGHLKLSYDRLRDPKIKNCFLYCSLFPEDFVIRKDELIESWIDEGLLDGLETRQAMHDIGYSILKKLKDNCLLESAFTDGVKMHDVLRDMALMYIKDRHSMVKAGMQLEEVPSELEWTSGVEMVSLMENKISHIPPHMSPKCPHLSTLILNKCRLRSISESFFKHMLELKVLDLSYNYEIVDLPKSISNLKNLNALIFRGCDRLKYVPSLAELRALRKLDLSLTAIEEVPHGIEMLKNLRYLRLSSRNLKELPLGMLLMIPHMQCLIFEGGHVMGEEAGKLKKLEYVRCSFCDMQEFKKYVESIQGKWPTYFHLQVGITHSDTGGPNFKNILKAVTFEKCETNMCYDKVVPSDLHSLRIKRCEDFKCLSNVRLFHKAIDLKLKSCDICYCPGMECVVDLSSSSRNALQNIELLYLKCLYDLQEVVRRVRVGVELESTSHAPSPPAFFFTLKMLCLDKCPTIRKLFPIDLLQGLPNLEIIIVCYCSKMEEIIISEENHEGEGTTFILPKLKSLWLRDLPKLKSICGVGVMIPVDHLEYLEILECPEVERMPLCLPLDENGQPSPPPSLRQIKSYPREWWESVEWDQPRAKHLLSPFVK